MSSECKNPTISPVAVLIPLFNASYIPKSGSEIILISLNLSFKSFTIPSVLSLDPPSTIIYSISLKDWLIIDSIQLLITLSEL